MPTKLGEVAGSSMTRPCECGLGLRPRRLFGFRLEPIDGAPCFFSGSLTLGGCGLPSTDRFADCFVAGNGKIQGGPCIDPKGYDAGKKISGKKRHILVDTTGLLMHAVVHPADIQDRDGGLLVLASLFGLYPLLQKLFADGGYQGPQFRRELAKLLPRLSVDIVKRSDTATGL